MQKSVMKLWLSGIFLAGVASHLWAQSTTEITFVTRSTINSYDTETLLDEQMQIWLNNSSDWSSEKEVQKRIKHFLAQIELDDSIFLELASQNGEHVGFSWLEQPLNKMGILLDSDLQTYPELVTEKDLFVHQTDVKAQAQDIFQAMLVSVQNQFPYVSLLKTRVENENQGKISQLMTMGWKFYAKTERFSYFELSLERKSLQIKKSKKRHRQTLVKKIASHSRDRSRK